MDNEYSNPFFCTNCGQSLAPDVKQCPVCGQNVDFSNMQPRKDVQTQVTPSVPPISTASGTPNPAGQNRPVFSQQQNVSGTGYGPGNETTKEAPVYNPAIWILALQPAWGMIIAALIMIVAPSLYMESYPAGDVLLNIILIALRIVLGFIDRNMLRKAGVEGISPWLTILPIIYFPMRTSRLKKGTALTVVFFALWIGTLIWSRI